MRAGALVLLLSPAAIAAPAALAPSSALSAARSARGSAAFDGSTRRLDRPEERIEAFRLVHDRYVDQGLATAHPRGVRITAWDLQPRTAAFGAFRRDRLAMTLSVTPDGPLGLPIERAFGPEIERLRREPPAAGGRRLAEITGLAAARADSRLSALRSVLELSRLAALYAFSLEVTDLLIAVHPRHANFHGRAMGFKPLAPNVRLHPGVGAPAAALHMPIERALAITGVFDGRPLPRISTAPQPEEDLRRFASLRGPE